MDRKHAWVLNLDADVELGGARAAYQPSRRLLETMRPHQQHLASALLEEGDVLIDEDSPAGVAYGLSGRAFCPTPRALRLLRRAGAQPEPHPSVEVLRRVNARSFASGLGATLPGAAFVRSDVDAIETLRRGPDVGDGWRVKFAHGMAGRNQRVIAPGALAENDREFVARGLRLGGVQIEPNVPIVTEYALHGRIALGGGLELGVLVLQRCDARGAWVSSERAGERSGELANALAREAARVATALHESGYVGPFGVDAYTYLDRRGELCQQLRSEINARYSMGFAVGFGRR